jgi:hypothetical protein
MKPPKNISLAEFFKQMKKMAKVSRNSLAINFYLPGHGAVSEADSILRERLGAFPFDMEHEVSMQSLRAYFS